ncbi:multi-sensor hybrid histidine kinase [Nostoc commune NIES-4072]|uniref:Circadian input-output histidine kinase CikA n=1 Tax=Nostoc commune NIES-4072 TaxID=2005467 RepID=A0A2R5FV95_NOSCO|nr:histidine kinase dimerization/phospho-acceptor domain-containing protein [Nostoc commune]BBD69241.1 multi-sensor hybrid histidine kinase [Nostoc commune HK-02]GBG19761.1 multi-sensor hybrid histidine kinase [Nostoc commune NIES-4072]
MASEGEGLAVNSVFIEGGEIVSLMRSLDWSQTALGYVADWPQSLRSAISILLASKAQICLFWGSELITIYNDAYRPALASKHPWALGRPAHEAWSEVWNVVEPLLKGVVATGIAFWAQDHLFFLNRHGYIEETYFDVSYDPVRDESGKVGGVFCIVSETTGRVLGDRRLQTLSLLSRETAQAKTTEAACLSAIQALATNSHDIPFAMLYQVEADGRSAKLVGTTPMEETGTILSRVNLTQHSDAWKIAQVYHTGEAAIVDDLTTQFGALPTGAWDKPPSAAWVVPLIAGGQKQIVGLLVLGINPYQAFEGEYRKFFDLLVGNMTIAIANARAYEEERKRLEALAELDRAKTTFFNNISHEFRTPLTLMLSPLKEMLTELDGILPTKAQEKLEMVQRNGTRLLKLVNTLLDFSRIEAGRTIASYEPIDLATYTAELASIFRSAADSAGLQLIVDCPPLAEPVYVDREMWEKEERYRTLFESIDEGFCVIEMLFDENDTPNDYRFLEINPSFEKQAGLKDVQGKRIRDLVPNHDKHWFEIYGKVAITGEPVRFENRAVALQRWFDVYAFRIGQPQQRQVAVLFKDISDAYQQATQRQLAEAALRESEELKQRILDSSHDCIKVLTLDGRVLYLNKGGLHLLEIDEPASFLNAEWIDLWQGEDREKAAAAIAAAKIGNVGQFQGYCPTAKGKAKWWDVIVTSVRNASGIIAQLLVVSRDITKQKQAEAEREQLFLREQAAREQAQTANRIKDEFLAVLSHELRSPLNPILGWSRLLRNGTLNAAKTAIALETIERNAKLQAQLIEDLLDISRILSGKLNLEMAPVNLASTIEAAIETVRLAAEAKSIEIQRIFDPNIGQILGDSARLQQVFWNLLTNAVKFSFAGGRVEIRLECRDSQAQITVSDTGKGINPDFLPYVFESFRQADATTTRKFGGLGLGLAIVRHLVELHGGTVQVDSAGEGQGAIFNVRFPLMKAQSYSQKVQEDSSLLTFNTSPLTGIRLLIVDDDEDIRDFLGFVLEQAGAEVCIVTSAIEALQAVEQSPPDILLSDIGMPEMDGYMLIRQIRAMLPEQGGKILALALSAYAGEVNRQQALAAGFQQHVAKPIDPDRLIAVILDIIAKRN